MNHVLAACGYTGVSVVMRYDFRRVSRCNMCGGHRFRLLGLRLNRSQGLSPKKVDGVAVSIKRCRDCDLIFADPQPVPEQLSDHYGVPTDDYWTFEAHRWTPDYFAGEIAEAKRLLRFERGMRALDIGVGLGKAVKSLTAAGFDVWGCEPIPEFRLKAIEIQGLDPDRIQPAAVENADYPESTFDFVTFGAVLEHIYDPKSALDRAMKWLRPGGVMQIEVPSSNWLIARLVNLYFRLRGTNFVTHISPMHSPFHLYEFSPKSFRDYQIASQFFGVCDIPHVPDFLKPIFRRYMEVTQTGMQLTVYLRRGA